MEIIASLNPVLRGWGNCFRTGNAAARFNQIDACVHARITRWLWRRGGQRPRFRPRQWPFERLFSDGSASIAHERPLPRASRLSETVGKAVCRKPARTV